MNVKEFYNINYSSLNVDELDIKLKIIISKVLNFSRNSFILHLEDEILEKDLHILNEYIKRLESGEPVQYLVNNQEFFGFDFYVDSNVLIPQPDTEILVEETIKNILREGKKVDVLDLCTGSGAVAISVEKNTNNFCNMFASDISKNALKIADKNAKMHNSNIKFIESNLFENINNKFNYIISNPPYIKNDVINSLSNEVKHEPYIALAGGKDGLDFYRKIIIEAKNYLKENGTILLEIGFDQKDEVISLLEKNLYKNIKCVKDLGKNDRVIIANI